VQDKVKEILRQGAAQGRETRRGRRLGASIQGGVLQGEVKGRVLLDVTPLSLGIETAGRRDVQADRQETPHPDQAEPGLLTADDNSRP